MSALIGTIQQPPLCVEGCRAQSFQGAAQPADIQWPCAGDGHPVYWICMSPPERRHGEPPKESEAYPEYCQAAWYADEPGSSEAYFQAQEALFVTNFELSAYRFQLDQVWHVAVLGDSPPAELDQTVQGILARGEPATLPAHILMALNQRRIQARKLGPWVERHYRPGKPTGG